jgi:hypothetical protein
MSVEARSSSGWDADRGTQNRPPHVLRAFTTVRRPNQRRKGHTTVRNALGAPEGRISGYPEGHSKGQAPSQGQRQA